MQILGYVIVKSMRGYELRYSKDSDQYAYLSSSFDGLLGYLRMTGYPEPPYEIPFIIEAY